MSSIQELRITILLDSGFAYHRAGSIDAAAQRYREVLKLAPHHPRALYLLGTVALQAGDADQAEILLRRAVGHQDMPDYYFALGRACKNQGRLVAAQDAYRRAIAIAPDVPAYYVSLGIVYREQENFEQAQRCFERALELQPDSVEALINLGNVHQSRAEWPLAQQRYREALDRRPDHAEAAYNLARACAQQGAVDQAQALYKQVLMRQPRHARSWFNLGNLYRDQHDYRRAVDCYGQALGADPGMIEAHSAFGTTVRALHDHFAAASEQDFAAAETCFRQVLASDGTRADAHLGLGHVLRLRNSFAEAAAAFQRALKLSGDTVEICTALCHVTLQMGDVPATIAWSERAIAAAPEAFAAASSRLILLSYVEQDATVLADSHRAFGSVVRAAVANQAPATTAANPERCLRVGYLSADFRHHSIAWFIEPLFAHHDRESVRVVCYHTDARVDAVTQRLRTHADEWVDCAWLDDAALAQRIRDDAIDILIDLSGHSAGNRLALFARRPAPLQLTYLGYPATTGVSTIDYRVTDHSADPPGSEVLNVETLLRLPHSYFCYQPPLDAPAVTAPPALDNGFITFGCFNALYKISDAVLDRWASLLAALPDARLLLKTRGLSLPVVRDSLLTRFRERGVAEARLVLHDFHADTASHLALYGEVDIALDTFPYNGATTTCEALWMGVPVVSLSGEWPSARMGLSILKAAGLAAFATEDPEDYVATALTLANDRQRLTVLRDTLRDRLLTSPLLDAAGFTGNLEQAYRQIWRRWCMDRQTEANRDTVSA